MSETVIPMVGSYLGEDNSQCRVGERSKGQLLTRESIGFGPAVALSMIFLIGSFQ